MYQDLRGKNDADDLYKCFSGMLQDSLNLRKMNLIGAKMKIYMERMRTTSFLELLNHFQKNNEDQWADLETTEEFFETSRMVCKKIQLSMAKSLEFYKQAHVRQNNLSSLTLGVLTNSVYQMTDIWNMANCVTHYCLSLHDKIKDTRDTNKKIYKLAHQFDILKQSDFDKKLAVFKSSGQINRYHSDQELHIAINRQIDADINQVMKNVNEEMKSETTRNDILNFYYALLNDDALVRLRFFKFQQQLIESSFLGPADVSPMIERERENFQRERAAHPTGIRGMFSHDEDFISPPEPKENDQRVGGWNVIRPPPAESMSSKQGADRMIRQGSQQTASQRQQTHESEAKPKKASPNINVSLKEAQRPDHGKEENTDIYSEQSESEDDEDDEDDDEEDTDAENEDSDQEVKEVNRDSW